LLTEFDGSWRIYSARLFYDEGGAGEVGLSDTTSQRLELSASGTWRLGTSSGQYSVDAVSADDWTRWGVEPYGPQRKITLVGWNSDVADGPVEASDGRVDFLWVIYHESPPAVSAPGTAWLKFGR
jgi:hypothetical protein